MPSLTIEMKTALWQLRSRRPVELEDLPEGLFRKSLLDTILIADEVFSRIATNEGYLRKPPQIEFSITSHSKCEALAFVRGKSACVAINDGFVALIYDLFYRLLSHPDVFPDIGVSRQERIGSQHKTGIYRSHDEAIENFGPSVLEVVAPRCAFRQQYADTLARCAIIYLLLHEHSHIYNGHCEYLSSTAAIDFICDIAGDEFTSQPLLKQVLEMNADAQAVSFGLRLSVLRPDIFSRRLGSRFTTLSCFAVPCGNCFFRDWIRAGEGLFHLFGWDYDSEISLNKTHPPSPQRRGFYTLFSAAMASQMWNADRDLFRSIAVQQSGEMMQAIQLICDDEGQSKLTTSVTNFLNNMTAGQRDIAALMSEFHRIKSAMAKFSYTRIKTDQDAERHQLRKTYLPSIVKPRSADNTAD